MSWHERQRRVAELMDADGVDRGQLSSSLTFIERVNRLLGYTRATLSHLDRLLPGWPAGRRLDVLDIATGTADVPRAVCGWADRRGIEVRVTAVDRHEATLAFARRCNLDSRITLLQADAMHLPFEPRSFDLVMSSMFLHHLDDDEVVAVVRAADQLARRGVILADLLRSRRALGWITLFTLLSNPMVKHDARVSVKQAFSADELLRLSARAGAGYLKATRHFGHRVVLSGLKPHG